MIIIYIVYVYSYIYIMCQVHKTRILHSKFYEALNYIHLNVIYFPTTKYIIHQEIEDG